MLYISIRNKMASIDEIDEEAVFMPLTISEVKALLDAEILTHDGDLDRLIVAAAACDLLSDLLAFNREQSILLTGLVNPQVIRTAEMIDLSGIVFVRGKKPNAAVIDLAEDLGMTLLTTEKTMFECCGILFSSGLEASLVVR
jgi:hypothetical protein